MLSKNWCVALAVAGLTAFGAVSGASAAGHVANGSFHARGGVAAGYRAGNGGFWGNSGQFLRAENGIFGPAWAYGSAYGGYGGPGYGWGYGYGYPGWGYSPWIGGWELEGVPYFAQFPPVYYGYGDNMPIVKASIRSSWAGSEGPSPSAVPAAVATPSRPPLRITNPYYVETKADKP